MCHTCTSSIHLCKSRENQLNTVQNGRLCEICENRHNLLPSIFCMIYMYMYMYVFICTHFLKSAPWWVGVVSHAHYADSLLLSIGSV